MSTTANYVDAVREIAAGNKPTKVYAGMPKEDRDRLKEEKIRELQQEMEAAVTEARDIKDQGQFTSIQGHM